MQNPQHQSLASRIDAILRPSLASLGFELVQVSVREGRRKTVQILAERSADQQMSVDDCSLVSRTASMLLDVEDPITSAYDLEVSSPGMDRPLIRAEDYAKYASHEIKLETFLPIDGRKRFKGLLQGIEGNEVVLVVDSQQTRIPFESVAMARLVITDEMIRTATNRAKHQERELEAQERAASKQAKEARREASRKPHFRANKHKQREEGEYTPSPGRKKPHAKKHHSSADSQADDKPIRRIRKIKENQ